MLSAGQPPDKVVINVGCGPLGASKLPRYFDYWRLVRIDIDASVQPDVIADVTNLSMIESGSVDAIWAAHCIEHIYAHQVRLALLEFYRVLRNDGFLCVVVPDLQSIAQYVVTDRLNDIIYHSKAGPVTAHDMIYGFEPAIAQGNLAMAHHCGFTPNVLIEKFRDVPFGEVVLRRSRSLEIAAVARKTPARDATERTLLLDMLNL